MEKLKIERMNGMSEEELNKVCKIDIQLDIDKMNRIYDLEQELGITLEVLFKALKDGIWVIDKEYVYDGYHIEVVLIGDKYNQFLLQDFNYNVWELKDYGKTWALTKEELE